LELVVDKLVGPFYSGNINCTILFSNRKDELYFNEYMYYRNNISIRKDLTNNDIVVITLSLTRKKVIDNKLFEKLCIYR